MNICTCKNNDRCKSCYDKDRYLKIKQGTWKFNNECPLVLTSEQEQVLIGGLLGDLYLYQYKNQINAGISIGRSIKDLSYLKYQFNIFKDFCQSGVKTKNQFDKRTDKNYIGCYFRTQATEVFTPYRALWYPDNEKIVPRSLKLTPLICAIWFCDDGSIVKCGPNKNRIKPSIYTDGFLIDDVEFLANKLNITLGTNLKITHKNSTKDIDKGYYIYSSKDCDTYALIKYINPVFPKCMNRKSNRWKGLI